MVISLLTFFVVFLPALTTVVVFFFVSFNCALVTIFLKNEKAKRVMNVITKAISLVVSVIFAIWAYQYLKLCLKMGGRTQILKIPMLASRGALVVGYMLPVLYNVYHMIVSVQELLHPGSTDETFENPAMGGEKK